MHKKRTALNQRSLAAVLASVLIGCGTDRVTAPVTQLPVASVYQLAVSEPTVSANRAVAASSGGLVYVAFANGDLPNVRTIRISNLSLGLIGSVDYTVTNGALDPVAIPGFVGDTLGFHLTALDGSVFLVKAAVPAKRAPRIVRTDPPKGRTDVTLNSRIRVVFSEPMDLNTITTATIRLTDNDHPVSGQFVFEGPPTLVAEFVPTDSLLPGRTYQVAIDRGIRDAGGDSLEASLAFDFRTVAPGSLLVTATTFGGGTDADGYIAEIEGQGHTTSVVLVNGVTTSQQLDAGVYRVTLAGLATNCRLAVSEITTVTVSANASTSLPFLIECLPTQFVAVGHQSIAFVSDRDGNQEIYAVNADGSELTRLTFNGANDTDPAWSPDGTRLAFTSDRAGLNSWGVGSTDIYVMNADGSNVQRLTHTGFAREPAWSPDGTRIAYADRCNGQGCIEVIAAQPEPNNYPIQVGPTTGFTGQPSWSPDGKEIALVNDGDAYDFVYDIYLADVGGQGLKQLTHGFGLGASFGTSQIPITSSLEPAFGQDGRIAVIYYQEWVGPTNIGIMRRDGTGLVRIADVGDRSNWTPWPPSITWSPDGGEIAYSVSRCTGSNSTTHCTYALYRVASTGGNPVNIVANGWSPSWRK